ncbi:MAG: DUF3631 domain-containing protein [Streptosporangiaceae bacterium]
MTAFTRLVDALSGHGGTVRTTGTSKATATCPAHEDRNPSLSVTGIEGQALVYCHAGCQTVDVLAALGLTMTDLFDSPLGVEYRYNDGRLVHRSPDKRFRQSGYTKALPAGAFLYRVDRVLAAVGDGRPVFVVEGEKDVHAMESLGVTATCSPMGARKWNKVDPSPLYGGKILVIADQDDPGRAHAQQVYDSLRDRCDVALFAPKVGKDAADHVAAGYGVGDLVPTGSTASAGSTGPVEGVPGASTGSTASAGSTGLPERVSVADGAILDTVRKWLSRFICTVSDGDLDLLALWAVHTHLCHETYTTPRLVLDSPVPGSGKTTVLEHLERLCLHPIQMASLSSPALLTRMLDAGKRTILIDEADRSLAPDKDGVKELLAVLNSGYKRGGTRPVLVPIKGGGWDTKEMPTFAPVAMAGNNPNLPDDTRSRSIRVLLMPDIDGQIEDSDWELYDDEARDLGLQIAVWSDGVRDTVRTTRPELPAGIRGRARERWAPLKRVAAASGGRWLSVVDDLADLDMRRIEAEREEGIVQQRPAVVLLAHLHEVFDDGETFVPTEHLIDRLVRDYPSMWGDASPFGKRLTPQRLGRMLVTSYNIHSDRPGAVGPRGYLRTSLAGAFRRFGLDPSERPVEPARPAEPVGAGPSRTTQQVPDKEVLESVQGGAAPADSGYCACGRNYQPDGSCRHCEPRSVAS